MRTFIIAVILLLGVMFVIGQLAEMQAVMSTLREGDWRYLLLAVLVEVVLLVLIALVYRTLFLSVGLAARLDRLILLSLAANFVNVIAPTAGVGGMAVFITQARQRGDSVGKVTVAGVLYVLIDYASFLCVLALGLIVLFRRNNLTTADIIASAVLLAIAMVMAILMAMGARSAERLGNALAWLARLVNRVVRPFTHREYLSEARAHRFAQDASDALHEISRKPANLTLPLLLALINKALLISILSLTFLAFNVPFSAGTLIAGFSIAYLFLIVSPTPSGIGIVEGILTLSLSSLYVPLSAAAVIALAYRGVTFWLPLAFGTLSVRVLAHQSALKSPA
ncbi:MAG: lysylphosphatidylglycerol synthase transmembrane domain-containing protein [Anaerolineales bacterium]|nr:lysylphosphatidylglycerol synthase transmembrane domain-containing protein [Anaerolineales bacterium]